MIFGLKKRLEAAERAIAALEQAARTQPADQAEDKPPAFKLDDAKMQEGIANLMGYDPFGGKESER